MNSDKPVVIVAQPGRVRDGLQALLMAMPQIQIVGLANDLPSALTITVERAPDLVLLDADLQNGGYATALGQIKHRWPETRCLVLTNSVHQCQEARSAGADEALLKGFSGPKLFGSVHKLVTDA
jgi:DNA-binding NarL/FixJ family response regulator